MEKSVQLHSDKPAPTSTTGPSKLTLSFMVPLWFPTNFWFLVEKICLRKPTVRSPDTVSSSNDAGAKVCSFGITNLVWRYSGLTFRNS